MIQKLNDEGSSSKLRNEKVLPLEARKSLSTGNTA